MEKFILLNREREISAAGMNIHIRDEFVNVGMYMISGGTDTQVANCSDISNLSSIILFYLMEEEDRSLVSLE